MEDIELAEEMEMPCLCQHCGKWFDLNDGHGSEKWYPNTVICPTCGREEEAEIERDEEISELKDQIHDAVYTIEDDRRRLKELGVVYENGIFTNLQVTGSPIPA
jgi:peptide subunit release factor 1 (eRF1)